MTTTTTTNEANKEEEEDDDDDYDLLYGDVGDFSDDEERKTTTTKRSTTIAIETGDGDAIGKKGRTDEDQDQEDQGTTKEHERGGEKEEEDKTEEDDDEEKHVRVRGKPHLVDDRSKSRTIGRRIWCRETHPFLYRKEKRKEQRVRGGGVYDRKSGRTVRRKSEQKSDRRQSVRGDASTIDKGRGRGNDDFAASRDDNDNFTPPPDTAWKGPIPDKAPEECRRRKHS